MRPDNILDDRLGELIDTLELVHDEHGIRVALRDFAEASGFEHFAYVCLRATDSLALTSYPVAWQERYLDQNFKILDPVITIAKRTMRPFTWSGSEMRHLSAVERSFFGEADAFGIRSGISIPIPASFGRLAMITLASGRPKADPVVVHDLVRAATAVAFVHVNLIRASANLLRTPEFRLSARETTCMSWASFGKTMAETASMLGIAENTVRFYLVQARDKLGANNITHAVRIAVEHDLI
jgi:LuxR family transcriptional regulator, activator of conjugal transfer of Ti plasmids